MPQSRRQQIAEQERQSLAQARRDLTERQKQLPATPDPTMVTVWEPPSDTPDEGLTPFERAHSEHLSRCGITWTRTPR